MKYLISICLAMSSIIIFASEVVDHYDFQMLLFVPRIYNNNDSLGIRKYQRQRLRGELLITYDGNETERPVITITNLVNQTHKINGINITYKCTVDDGSYVFPRVNLIGSNLLDLFKTPSMVFYLDAEPSYNKGKDDEDNSLLLTLSGFGKTGMKESVRYISYVRGNAAGTLGCGCKAYGHISPTRIAGWRGATDRVDDVASVFGTWRIRWKYRDYAR